MFDHVDLEDSFVLGWDFNTESRRLVFDLEASLWKGHEHYTKPSHHEFTCYKRAQLVFEDVESIDGLLSMEKVIFSTDIDGSIDYGVIEGFHQSGNDIYKFGGDFGEVTVECKDLHLDFSGFKDNSNKPASVS